MKARILISVISVLAIAGIFTGVASAKCGPDHKKQSSQHKSCHKHKKHKRHHKHKKHKQAPQPEVSPPSPPAQTKQKPWAELMEAPSLEVGKSSELCASLYNPEKDEFEIEFRASTGYFLGLPIYEPMYSEVGICDIYTAPLEAGTDSYWVVIHDLTTKETIQSEVKPIVVRNTEPEHGGWH